jgi:MerR family transcriptional regulator, thiopeptide resistance regulator
MPGPGTELTIGVLARRTGLSVRTLHHYDHVGLLKPSDRTAAGYRLYGLRDVIRLQQIVMLRSIGMSLDDIRRAMSRDGTTLRGAIEAHARRLRDRIDGERRLLRRLERTAETLRRKQKPTIDDVIRTVEAITMMDEYFTDEQREWMKERRVTVGEDRIREVEAEWPPLIAAVREEMKGGPSPDDPRVQALAERWGALVQEFTDGNLGIARSVGRMYQNEPSVRQKTGIDGAMMDYVSRAGAFKGRRGR